MREDHFVKYPDLDFAEVRYSKNSGRQYKPHMHQSFSIGAIDQGEVVYRVQGTRLTLQPGSLALINPEVLHSCNPTESCKRTYYVLYLDVGWCLELQQSLWQIETFRPVSRALLDDPSVFGSFIYTMECFIGEGEMLEKEQRLVDLVETIFLSACEPADPVKTPSLRIEQLKRQLGLQLDADMSLQQLALELDANPFTLLRQFKSATGITPHAYRLNCRIEFARQLLQDGLDLSQVALACGFFDQSHFHRHFIAITSVTPREYQVNFIQ